MRSPKLIVVGAGALAALAFAVCYLAMGRMRDPSTKEPADPLAWLRVEFKLSDAEMARIRGLHEGYLPKCEEMCARIAVKNIELAEAMEAATNVTPAIAQKLSEVAACRAECQQQMLQHFYEVSQAMPREQGQRYIEEMKRLTLGVTTGYEQSMHGTQAPGHGQPRH